MRRMRRDDTTTGNLPTRKDTTLKRILITTVPLAAALALAATAAGKTTTSMNLAVDGMHATRTFVDALPKHTAKAPNDSPGDTVVMHAPLLDTRGRRVGTIDATFLTTAPGTSARHDGSEQLTGTLTSPAGRSPSSGPSARTPACPTSPSSAAPAATPAPAAT